jgi:uncharacterized repeat protein (TIGR01451 family)
MMNNASINISTQLRVFAVFSIVLFLFCWAPSAIADQLVQMYYVPITEPEYRLYARAQSDPNSESDLVRSVISITGTFNGTIIYYDQWEDGYEADLSNPQQSTTQIWGDGNWLNGAPPGCSADGCDVINAGTVITLQSDVPVTGGVRDQGNMFFDGKDKLGSTQQLVVTRAMWPVGAPGAIGSMLAGSVEVLRTDKWGSSFQVPVGINLGQASFNYTAVSVMAQKDGTVVQVQNPDLSVNITQTLNEGETLHVTGIRVGATITSTGGMVQVDMLTATPGSAYDGRLYALIPTANLGNTYYCPVSTTQETNGTTFVYNNVIVYNPNAASIQVNVTCMAGTAGCPASQNIGSHAAGLFQLPLSPTNPNTLTGAMFSTTGNEPFYAISAIDINGTVHNWGFTLVPLESLTPSVIVGWSPGTTNLQRDASPVWITPVANTTIYVDYDGNPATGPNTDPEGNKYNVSYNVLAMQSQKVFSPGPAGSYDHTGYRIYTVDGTRIAAAWGQDGYSSSANQPTELDLGTTVLPYPSLVAYKSASLLADYNNNGALDPGELLLYTIRIHNGGIIPITNINLLDTLDPDVTYVADTTARGSTPVTDTPVPDDNAPKTRFPLDETGYNIVLSPSELNPGQDIYVTFQATANNPLPPNKFEIINNARVSSISEIFLNSQISTVSQGKIEVHKTSSIAPGSVKPGDTIEYTITATNTSSTPQTGIQLSDPLPSGTSYVASSTTATGPRQKLVRDRFNQLLYSNNDGPENWTANWAETDAGGGGSTGGNVQVINGELRLTTAGSAAVRAVNLSEFAGGYAILRFNYRTNPAFAAGDSVIAEISPNGSVWTTLQNFTGITGATSGSKIFNISPYILATTTVRFRVVSMTAGNYFYADNVEIRAVGANKTATDDLSSNTYTGGSGWSGNWIENDALGGSQAPAAGKVQAIGGRLRLTGPPVGAGNPTEPNIARTADFSGYVFGILSFDYQISNALAAYAATVEVLSKDGTTYVPLETFTNITNQSGSRIYDITNYLHTNTTVRFRITNGYGGANQYYYIDNVTITAGRQLMATKDNITGGANPDLVSGVPANIVLPADGFALAPGEALTAIYRVTADNPLNVTRVVNTVTATTHEKAPPASSTTIDPVSTGGTIGDLVWLDTVQNGVYDNGEPGLYNVRVLLNNPGIDGNCCTGDDVYVRDTLTGTDGKYRFEGLLPGTYCTCIDNATLPAGVTLITAQPSPVTIILEENFATNDFGYQTDPTKAVIGNYIWSDANNNGIQDPGEIGIAGVTVQLLLSGVPVQTVTSDPFGTYLFTNVNPGTYTIVITDTANKLSGYSPTTGPQSLGIGVGVQSSPLTVSAGSSYTMMDFGFRNPSLFSISDRLWFDSDNNGSFDSGEPGIKNVTVTLLNSGGNVVGTTVTDLSGNFSFTGVPNGNYTIKIEDATGELTGFAGTTTAAQNGQLPVNVSGGNVSGINFGYNAPGRIGDTVWRDLDRDGIQDSGEPGISGVTVELYKDTNGDGVFDPAIDQLVTTTTTDADGNYMFQVSEAGRFFVSIDDTQASLLGLALTTIDNETYPGAQRQIDFLNLNTSYLGADFGFMVPLPSALSVTKTSDVVGNTHPGDIITYTINVTNTSATTQTGIQVIDAAPDNTTYVPQSTLVTGKMFVPNMQKVFRVTEYYITAGVFATGTYNLTLNQDLMPNYFVIIQGSDGSGTTTTTPAQNYASLIGDPWGTGDLVQTAANNTIRLSRGGTLGGGSWVGVVTVVESLGDETGSGFRLLDVQRVLHSGTGTSGTDLSGTAWSDINQVMLMGGFNGAGCDTTEGNAANTKVCHVRIWPSGTNTINWTRDAGGATLSAATSTVMVLEWGSNWNVQRVNVTGNNGGDGADATTEYNTSAITQVARANTWVWGTGHTNDNGIGDASEGVLITLGDGVNQNADETSVAVGIEYNNNAVNFEVYALTHTDLAVNYVKQPDGNQNALTVDVAVSAATDAIARMALVSNGCNNTNNNYPRPMFSARYTSNTNVRLERRRSGENFPAWIQGVDFKSILYNAPAPPVTVIKDNIPGGVNADLINGVPFNLVLPGDSFVLQQGNSMSVTYRVQVNSPLSTGVTQITNQAAVSSNETPQVKAYKTDTLASPPGDPITKSAPDYIPYPLTTLSAAVTASPIITVNSAQYIKVGDVIFVGGTAATVLAVNGTTITLDTNVTAGAGSDVLPTIKFTLTYANDGNSALTNVVVTDSLLAGLIFVRADHGGANAPPVTWNLGTVAAHTWGTLHLWARPPSAGTYTNSATSTSTEQTVTSNTTTTRVGGLELAKVTTTPTVVNTITGTTATYVITVRNNIPATTALNISVTDTLPSGFTYASTTSATGCTGAVGNPAVGSATPTWTCPALATGATLTITFVSNIASSVPNGTYQNPVTATSSNVNVIPFDHLTTTAEDVTVTRPVDIQITKVVQSQFSPCYAGECEVSYLVTATNIGSQNATVVNVTDLLPATLTYQSSVPGKGTYNSTNGLWTITGGLSASESATLQITALVNPSQFSLTITNCASLTASTPSDSFPDNNESCVNITPTLVTLSDFMAYEDNGRVAVEWSTSSEYDTAGFYLYRLDETTGDYMRINRKLLPALLTSSQGGTYSLIDIGASPKSGSLTYLLVEMEGRGSRNVYGPFTVQVGGKSVTGSLNPDAGRLRLSGACASGNCADRQRKASASEITLSFDMSGNMFVTNRKDGQTQKVRTDIDIDLFEGYMRKAHEMSEERKIRLQTLQTLKEQSHTAITQNNMIRTGSAVKISISEKGLFYLDASAIGQMLGISAMETRNMIKYHSLAMSNQGKGVAYLPAKDNAGIFFYGKGIDSKYTTENIYWVSKGSGIQISSLIGKGPAPAGYGTFSEKLHFEQDRFIVPGITRDPNVDYMFWDAIDSDTDPATCIDPWDPGNYYCVKEFTTRTNGVANGANLKATLTANLYGFSDTVSTPDKPDHHIKLYMNNTFIGEEWWDGQHPHGCCSV